MPTQWQPSGLLSGTPTTPYALLILNQPINAPALTALLPSASLLVCADAGADRYFQYQQSQSRQNRRENRLPDAIVGDLDSLSDEVRVHYESLGVKVIEDPDQFSTDFTKCLLWIRRHWAVLNSADDRDDGTLDVVVFGGLGGRVDQGFSQIHHLYMAQNDLTLLKGRIYLVSEQSLSFILSPGLNEILLSPSPSQTSQQEQACFASNIGIIPISGRTRITTHGLEWDVVDWITEFGGQMSTSNHIPPGTEKVEITVQGDEGGNNNRPLVTIELAERLCAAHAR